MFGKYIIWTLCLIFLLNVLSMNAQDKIVVSKGETLSVGIQGGVGFMLARESDISRGCHYGADIHYMLNRSMSIGIKYSGLYASSGGFVIIDPKDEWQNWCVNTEERIYINFIGLSFRRQYYLNRSDKFKLSSGIALGYTHYRDETENDFYDLKNYLMKSNTIGGNAELGIEYFPLRWISLGVSTSCFLSWFRKGTITDGRNTTTMKFKDYELDNVNASRLDLSLDIKFHL